MHAKHFLYYKTVLSIGIYCYNEISAIFCKVFQYIHLPWLINLPLIATTHNLTVRSLTRTLLFSDVSVEVPHYPKTRIRAHSAMSSGWNFSGQLARLREVNCIFGMLITHDQYLMTSLSLLTKT